MFSEVEIISKKRKWDDPITQEMSKKPQTMIKSISLVSELEEDTPFPLEWQQCLDIRSGQIYFYNTRTNKRAFTDPRSILEPSSNESSMRLDLELNNLPCQSSGPNQSQDNYNKHKYDSNSICSNDRLMNTNATKDVKGLVRSPSWLTIGGDQQEMVTAVCKNCYMLVMMCKSTPACPNCKFVHPPDPNPTMFDQCLSLLC